MAQENVRKFEELLRTDEGLQAELRAAAEAFDGDPDDAKAVFDATLGKVAGGVGLAFSYEEGLAALASARELSDAELDGIAGGTGFCIIIGGNDRPEAKCDYSAGYACAFIGVTIW